MSADNTRFLITSTGDDHLVKAMELAFACWGGVSITKAIGWVDEPMKGLILIAMGDRYTAFPSPVAWGEARIIVRAWLDEADFGPEPDHDGDNEKGFTVYNEAWGHVGEHTGAICAIKPAWMMYGK